MSTSDIHIIIKQIEMILHNKNNEPIDQIGSYIVGTTMTRDDIDEYYIKYPALEEIAELGAELETLGKSPHAQGVLYKIEQQLVVLKNQTLEN